MVKLTSDQLNTAQINGFEDQIFLQRRISASVDFTKAIVVLTDCSTLQQPQGWGVQYYLYCRCTKESVHFE